MNGPNIQFKTCNNLIRHDDLYYVEGLLEVLPVYKYMKNNNALEKKYENNNQCIGS